MKRSMTIDVDPMPQHRRRAENLVNAHFNEIASERLHRDQAHRRKKEIAEMVLGGAAAPLSFSDEAQIAGVSAQTLAQTIADKPDDLMQRETLRRLTLAAVRSAATPDALKVALEPLGIPYD